MSGSVIIDPQGPIAVISLNRPEKKNALSIEMLNDIKQFLEEEVRKDEPARVLIFRSMGDVFSAGFDIGDLQKDISTGGLNYRSKDNHFESAFKAIQDYPYPTIGAAQGPAFGGGCMLLASCDIRIGTRALKFAKTPAKLALVYPLCGLERMSKVVGPVFAKEMFLTAMQYDADTALRTGYITHLVEPEELIPYSENIANHLLTLGPLALKGIKEMFAMIENGVDQERIDQIFDETLNSEDVQEGIKAFLEKRRPDYKGK